MVNAQFEWRERIGRGAGSQSGHHQFAVVRGPRAAAVAVSWSAGARSIPELIVVAGTTPGRVTDYRTVSALLERLASATETSAPPPPSMVRALRRIVRRRLAAAERGTLAKESRRLARGALRRAREAGRCRNLVELMILDRVLDRIATGLAVGPERELAIALERGRDHLARWVAKRANNETPQPWTCRIEAAVFGDGNVV